jgi:hypothetical protein
MSKVNKRNLISGAIMKFNLRVTIYNFPFVLGNWPSRAKLKRFMSVLV